MTDLLLPGHVVDEFDTTLADIAVARSFHRMLKAIDERLCLIWARPGSGFDPDGRWYIARRHANPELSTYWVIEDENGNYCEPQERHLERLQQMDTWTGRRVYKDFADARSARKRQQAKAFEDKRAEFREKLLERLAHVNDTRIAVPRLWTPPSAESTQAPVSSVR